jgi:hypothetical protein
VIVCNRLTHAKSATWLDADMAHSLIQHAIGIATSLIPSELRGVLEACPDCGSPDLAPEQGANPAAPGILGERPRCTACGRAGRSVPILENGQPLMTRDGQEMHDHRIMTVAPARHSQARRSGSRSLASHRDRDLRSRPNTPPMGRTWRRRGCVNECRAPSRWDSPHRQAMSCATQA